METGRQGDREKGREERETIYRRGLGDRGRAGEKG